MGTLYPLFLRVIAVLGLMLVLAEGRANAQAPAERPPALPPQSITLADARAIIDGAIAYARQTNRVMGVAVVDPSGDTIASARMDGASGRNVHFAEGKAFAAAAYRQTTESLSQLYKTRPDRYFGIMNSLGNKVYLVGGGEPLAINGVLVGAVGVAGLPEGEDEKAGRAGIDAWLKARDSLRK
jgi:uncharacterized protein GlcG (DUF336 family)